MYSVVWIHSDRGKNSSTQIWIFNFSPVVYSCSSFPRHLHVKSLYFFLFESIPEAKRVKWNVIRLPTSFDARIFFILVVRDFFFVLTRKTEKLWILETWEKGCKNMKKFVTLLATHFRDEKYLIQVKQAENTFHCHAKE